MEVNTIYIFPYAHFQRVTQNMVRAGLVYSNQHAKKMCFAAETSAEVPRYKIHSTVDNTSPHCAWYSKNPRIRELRTFGCNIYLITSFPTKLN